MKRIGGMYDSRRTTPQRVSAGPSDNYTLNYRDNRKELIINVQYLDEDNAKVFARHFKEKKELQKLTLYSNFHVATLEVGMKWAHLDYKDLGAVGAIIVGAWISHKEEGTLEGLNILGNSIGAEQANNLITSMKEKPTLKTLCGFNNFNLVSPELDLSNRKLSTGCGVLVANEINKFKALTSLNVSRNKIVGAAAWKAFGNALANNKTLLKLDVSDNSIFDKESGSNAWADIIKGNTSITELNIAKNHLDAANAKILGPAISANNTLTSLNILQNNLKEEGLKAIVDAWEANTCLQSICGATGTELDLSSAQIEEFGDIPVVCAEIKHNKAMTSLNIRDNNIGGGAAVLELNAGWTDRLREHLETFDNDKDGTLNNQEFGEFLKAQDPSTVIEDTIIDFKQELHLSDENITVDRLVSYYEDLSQSQEGMQCVMDEFKTLLLSLKPVGVIALADAINTNKTLKSLDISANNIGQLVGDSELMKQNGVTYKKAKNGNMLYYWDKNDKCLGEKCPAYCGKPMGLIAIADAISTNGAMTSLNISKNKIITNSDKDSSAGQALANMLSVNTTLTELDVSDNKAGGGSNGAPFAKKLAVGLSANKALQSLNISNNQLCGDWKTPNFSGYDALVRAIRQHELLTMSAVNMAEELDVSGQKLGVLGAKTMATFIKYNGALTSLNISNTKIGVLMTEDGWTSKDGYDAIPWVHPDGRSQNERPDGLKPLGVIALADAIKTNKALEKLYISKNYLLSTEFGKILSDAIALNSVLKVLDVSSQGLGLGLGLGDGPGFAQAFAVGLGTNMALETLNLSNNRLIDTGGEAGKALGDALKQNQTLKELDVSSNMQFIPNNHSDGAEFAKKLADGLTANTALKSLNISNNHIGAHILPAGWSGPDDYGHYKSPTGEYRLAQPGEAEGVIAIVNAIKQKNKSETQSALTSLNIKEDTKYYKVSLFYRRQLNLLVDRLIQ